MIYCGQCHWYTADACNAPQNKCSTYRGIARMNKPHVINLDNNCSWFELSWMLQIVRWRYWASVLATGCGIIIGLVLWYTL